MSPPPAARQTFVIVGASLAGAKAAATLREEGFDGRVVLVGAEPERPYERPPLSKDYLRGESGRARVFLRGEGFYAEQELELRLGRTAVALDLGAREVELDDGERLRYDRLLLATGAEPRRLPIPGATLDGVVNLRSLADAQALRERLDARRPRRGRRRGLDRHRGRGLGPPARRRGHARRPARRAARARARRRGRRGLPRPARRPRRRPAPRHRGHGVRGRRAGRARPARRRAHDRLPTSSSSASASRRGSGWPRCRARGRRRRPRRRALATSHPGVHAAGDIAAVRDPRTGERLRVEHWANALHQGPVAARAMLGRPAVHDRVPYFFSDQYDVGMEYSGVARPGDRVVFRGDPARASSWRSGCAATASSPG